ncbi:hypothetical protein SMKC072_09360 [Serratia marcescens]|jgi:hypothetical protein|nr:hypothetical protein [Serratia marcescens]BEN63114.1 hypothetical protein SMKC072_09360 [Serratia marcescens]
MKSKKIFQLDERKLSDQWLFKLAILAPLIASIFLCIPLWLETSIDLSAKGYDKFLSLYKLPIGTLSLSIPLVAIVAHIHRTIQTAAQIETTKIKNTTDSFFSHHKFMIEAFSKIPSKKITISNQEVDYEIKDPYHLYDNLFNGSSYENGIIATLIPEIKARIEESLEEINESLIKARDDFDNKKSKVLLLIKIEMAITSIESAISLESKPTKNNSLIMAKDDHGTVKIVTEFLDELELKEKLDRLLFFAKKVFQILNIHLKTEDELEFYSIIKTQNHCFFNEAFNDTVPTKLNKNFGMSINTSNKLDREYEQYLINLEELNFVNSLVND